MSAINLRSDIKVTLRGHLGSDEDICAAATVEEAYSGKMGVRKFIDFLMKKKHGTPFEHGTLIFDTEGPIFMYREWHRHRIGWSYNEKSQRWEKPSGGTMNLSGAALPDFYICHRDRPMIPVDSYKKTEPGFKRATDDQYSYYFKKTTTSYENCWEVYNDMLDNGIGLEIARMVLPSGIYSKCRMTCNPRSIMNFLSLRVHWGEDAKYPSYPQLEIQYAAEKLAEVFKKFWPLTFAAYAERGYVAP